MYGEPKSSTTAIKKLLYVISYEYMMDHVAQLVVECRIIGLTSSTPTLLNFINRKKQQHHEGDLKTRPSQNLCMTGAVRRATRRDMEEMIVSARASDWSGNRSINLAELFQKDNHVYEVKLSSR